MPAFRSIVFRRATAAALAGAMTLAILPAATMGVSSSFADEVRAAERSMLVQINARRASNGLAPLLRAKGAVKVARARSQSMATLNYFGHTAPSGANAATLLNRRGVQWNRWGENIGWTTYMDLSNGTRWMVDWWMGSSSHRANILSRNFNYAGVGITRDGAKLLYTVVFLNQYDHTPPMAKVDGSGTVISIAATEGSSARKDVKIRWDGRDRRLSVNTAGLAGFTVQYKKVGGKWRTIRWRTSTRELTKGLAQGGHKFRVRAVDRRGNRSGWSMVKVLVN